jgi:hypothetical protein
MLNIGGVQVSRPNELCVSCPFLWWKEHQLSCPFLWNKEHQLSCPLKGCNKHSVEVKSVASSGDMMTKWILLYEKSKNPIKTDGRSHCMKDKREGQMKHRPIGTKEGRELVSLMVGSSHSRKLSHPRPLACHLHANCEIETWNKHLLPTQSLSLFLNKGPFCLFLVMALFDWPINTHKKFNLWTLPKEMAYAAFPFARR